MWLKDEAVLECDSANVCRREEDFPSGTVGFHVILLRTLPEHLSNHGGRAKATVFGALEGGTA